MYFFHILITIQTFSAMIVRKKGEKQMKNSKHPSSIPKTFQYKLIAYNLAIVICIALAVSLYSFNSYKKDMVNTASANAVSQINRLSERLEVAYDEMVNILVNCTERNSIFYSNKYMQDAAQKDSRYNVFASDALRDLCAVSGYSKYIHKLTVYQKDGFILQAGSSSGNIDDAETIMNTPWFEEFLNQSTSQYSLRLVDNPFHNDYITNRKILPMLRPIKNTGGKNPREAWVFLSISPSLYDDHLRSLSANHIYAATNDGELISVQDSAHLPTSDAISQILKREEPNGSFRMNINGSPCIIAYNRQRISGLLLFEILPLSELNINHQVIFNTVLMIFLFCLLIGLLLAPLVSRQLTAPIKRLIRRLEIISTGNFDYDPAIETNDELGVIGRQINSMSSRISALLDSRIQSEKEKKDLEIKMLQAQINPHFLYNTLDSIKWIATMQKNSGIVQVVTALSSLLKNMAKGFNEKVTLRQELDFLNNYVIIEKIRYIELFDVEIQVDRPELYDAKIIKLTLQPIVENAIFSGIEPSGRFGEIQIHAYTEENTLYVSVTDNGIGIAPENIEKLLSDTSRVTKSNMSGIGLPNVDRRLKLVYGEEYGITVESELDNYTKITISLPLEY